MLWGEPQRIEEERASRNVYELAAMKPGTRQPVAFSIHTTTPLPTNSHTVMPRADDVNTMQRMFNDAHTSAVILIGNPGAGKSTLASLLYNRLLLAKQQDLPAPRHLVWLGIDTYTTLPDMLAAILTSLNMYTPGFFLLKPDQQIGALLQALRRPQENALVILDQFESLLHPEITQGVAGRGALQLFLEMIQQPLGASRILLTSYSSLFNDEMEETRVRSCLVSRISMPEGVALLQRRGVQGSPQELSLVWQRCAGHAFSLVLFCALVNLSGIALSYLLNSPDYQPLWAGDVMFQLITSVHHYLNPLQFVLMRALSLFTEPVPLAGIVIGIMGEAGSDSQMQTPFELELAILARLSLIQVSLDAAGENCYMLHPLLRQYMLEHYLDGNEQKREEALASQGIHIPQSPAFNSSEALQVAWASGHMQVAAYYQHITREFCPPREQRQGLQDVQPIVSAIRHLCLGGRWQHACDLLFAEGLHESMVQWGAWNTLIGLYTGLLPPFGVLLRRDEALVSSHVAMLYGRMGEYQQSQAYFEQALSTQRQVGDRLGEATTLANQGELYRMRGERVLARANFERALALSEEKQDLHLHGILLHNLGLLHQSEKDYKQAFENYLESLHLAYRLKDEHNQSMIVTNLGMLLYEQGMQREGMALLLLAQKQRQDMHDPTVIMLETFLHAVEQKMGADSYANLCQAALKMQAKVLARFVPLDMRQ
jgi:tetratricopeptide (TPR) repeat protein